MSVTPFLQTKPVKLMSCLINFVMTNIFQGTKNLSLQVQQSLSILSYPSWMGSEEEGQDKGDYRTLTGYKDL